MHSLWVDIILIQRHIGSTNEHVPEIERYIRTVKERVTFVYNRLPFKKIPLRMVTEMVYTAAYWLNMFPVFDGISKTLSTRAIVTELLPNFNLHCAGIWIIFANK